ncbi:MAG: HEAT repeat domain-containing protein [Planctomycetes bacterium]|nr:HEAT repeat domain-containing protein [Planctomycetota bacterium]
MSATEGRGVSGIAVSAIAVVALALGALGGAMFMKSRRPADAVSAAEGAGAAAAAPGGKVGGASDPGAGFPGGVATRTDSSATAVTEAHTEILRLQKRVAELENLLPKEKTKEDKIALAKEMVECLRKGKKNPDSFRRLLHLITELDPAMGPYFVGLLTDPNETIEKDPLYDIALSAGGPEVADWLLGRLTDPATDEGVRRRLLRILGGSSRELFSIRNLPVQGRLADTAFQYAVSGDGPERQAGAGLLGGIDSVEARSALYRLAVSDTELNVKEAAIRSLAYTGDKDTLPWLDTYAASLSGMSETEKQRMAAAVDFAREQVGKRTGK